MPRSLARVGVVLLASLVAACSPKPPAPSVARITVSPANASVAVGGTTVFTAAALDGQNNPIQTTFTWSTGDSSIATVSGGTVTGVKAGNTSVIATSGTISGSAFITVTPGTTYHLTLSVGGSGRGTVTYGPSLLSCSSSCSADYPPGTVISFSELPAPNNLFNGWGGACSGTGTNCQVTMNSDVTVSANFIRPPLLTVNVTGSGHVTSSPAGINCNGPTCAAGFPTGTPITLTAAANGTGSFTGWTGGGCAGTGTCQLTLTADTTVSASFSGVPTLSVSTTGSGTGGITSSPSGITCSETGGTCQAPFAVGTSVSLTAAPTGTSAFTGWSGSAGCTGVTNPCTFTMTSDATAVAGFDPGYALAVSTSAGGGVTSTPGLINCQSGGAGACSDTFAVGTVVTLTETPATGYAFTQWTGACSGDAGCQVMMSQPQSVGAEFNGPFDFAIDTGLAQPFSMIPGETRTLPITARLLQGAASPVALTISGLPPNVTATFNPTAVTPTRASTLTLTTTAAAALAQTTVTITGTSGTLVHTAQFTLEVRSPYLLSAPTGVVLQDASHVLVLEADRLDQVELTNFAVTRTITSELTNPQFVTLDSSTSSAYVTERNNVTRVNLTTGARTLVTGALTTPSGIQLESSGTTALVLDCGASGDCATSGRLSRVNLSSGALTPITPTSLGLNTPRGLGIESGGASVVIAERGSGDVVRVVLASPNSAQNIASPIVYGLQSGATEDLAIENVGASHPTALVISGQNLVRVDLTTGTQTLVGTHPSGALGGVALEKLRSVIVADPSRSTLVRYATYQSISTVAPSPASSQSLFSPYALSSIDGTNLALTDCGQTDCASTGRIMKVNINAGIVSQLASALQTPRGISVETGGTTALFVENPPSGVSTVRRVDLSNGALSSVATIPSTFGTADQIVAGSPALVQTPAYLVNVPLDGGAVTALRTASSGVTFAGLALSGGGATLVGDRNAGSLLQISSSGVVSTIATGFQSFGFVGLESAGLSALVTEQGLAGRLYRVPIANSPTAPYGQLVDISTGLGYPRGLSGVTGVFAEGNRLVKEADSSGAIMPTSIGAPRSHGVESPRGLAVEASGNLLVLEDCGFGSCAANGTVMRVVPTDGGVTQLAQGLASPDSIAISKTDAGIVFVTDCGPSNACSTAGRLASVNINAHTVTTVTPNLNTPQGVAVESNGTKALVCEHGANRLLEANLSSGAFTIVASSGLNNPRQVFIESSGTTALVADDSGIARVTIAGGAVQRLVNWDVERFVVEPAGTLLMISSQTGPQSSIARAHLTGSVSVLQTSVLDLAHSIVLSNSGSTVYFTEARAGLPASGLLLSFPTPP